MKRFLIHVSTNWCGMDTTYRAEANNKEELYDLACEIAVDNFYNYDLGDEVAEAEGYDVDNMSESDWDEMWSNCDEGQYYDWNIEEVLDDEDWSECDGRIYTVNSFI